MRNFFIFFLMLALSYTANAGTKIYGYTQITAESGQGVNALAVDGNGTSVNGGAGTSGLRFGAGAVRLGAKYNEGNTFGHLLLKFDGLSSNINGADDAVFFAYVGHKFDYGFLNKVMVGKFKNPIGMELNQAPNKMDIAKYDVLKTLQGGLVVGGMMSGDLGFGLSYDLAAFNTNTTATGNQVGETLGYAAKLAYDLNAFHFQVGYSIDNEKADASTTNTKTKISILDVGFSYAMSKFKFVGEYVAYTDESEGTSASTKDKDNAFHIHLGYKVTSNMEAIVRYVSYQYKTENMSPDTDNTLSNIWLGVNLWANTNERLQFNYVLAGGDKRHETEYLNPINGIYDANVFLAQYQVQF